MLAEGLHHNLVEGSFRAIEPRHVEVVGQVQVRVIDMRVLLCAVLALPDVDQGVGCSVVGFESPGLHDILDNLALGEASRAPHGGIVGELVFSRNLPEQLIEDRLALLEHILGHLVGSHVHGVGLHIEPLGEGLLHFLGPLLLFFQVDFFILGVF